MGTTGKIVTAGMPRTWSPAAARGRLFAAAALALAAVAVTLSPLRSGFAHLTENRPSDVALYRAEVDRIHAGEPYYAVLADELTTRGYPTRSVFNWRAPLPVWVLGQLPEPRIGQAVLAGIGLLVLCWGFAWIADEHGTKTGILAAAMFTGAWLPCLLGDLYVMPELWSGMLVALALCAEARGRRRCAILAGLAALFARELAAPYVLLALVRGRRARRRGETAWWGVGLAAYAVYYACHVAAVRRWIAPDALAHAEGWLRCGGAGFVISVCQMNAYLLLLPQWVTALALVAALVGFSHMRTPAGQAVGVAFAAYLAVFAIVGQPFNQYWGSMIAPLLGFGAALAPAAVRELWRAALPAPRTRLEAEPC